MAHDEERDELPASFGRRVWTWVKEILIIVVSALVLSFLLKTFFFQSFWIPSASMENTLDVGDRILVSKWRPGPFDLRRGDIVVFRDPNNWLSAEEVQAGSGPNGFLGDVLRFTGLLPEDAGEHLVKRVIGLPGDTVECKTSDGPVYVNGVALDEQYVRPGLAPCAGQKTPWTTVVPTDYVWVHGRQPRQQRGLPFPHGRTGRGRDPHRQHRGDGVRDGLAARPLDGVGQPVPLGQRGPERGRRLGMVGLERERSLWDAGAEVVAGIDEVGRGALAGPVSVGVVALAPCDSWPDGLADSKQLSAARRESIAAALETFGVARAVGDASNAEVDAVGITAALRLAALRALRLIADSGVSVDAVLLDGRHDWLSRRPAGLFGDDDGDPVVVPPVTMVVGGDATCASIAAGSVLAKVARDALMRAAHADHPEYGWDGNKGYGAPGHLDALRRLGPTPLHRVSWKPSRAVAARGGSPGSRGRGMMVW